MANTISMAVEYVNNQQEVLRMFNTYLLCADLMKRNIEHKGKTVSYDALSFASYVMGSYNRRNGLSMKDFVFERKTRELTQDRGDSLDLDIADQNEAQIAGGIARVYNFYQIKVAIPTMDGYAFGKLAGVGNGALAVAHGSITSANIIGALNGDFAKLSNKRVKVNECLLYITAEKKALLDEAAFGKGVLTVGKWLGNGEWDGNLQADVQLYKGAKVVELPNDYLAGACWVIVHPLAFDVIPVLDIVNFHDRVPGKPGLAQVDVREYFDAWTQPNGEDGIVIGLESPRKPVLPADASFDSTLVVKITGIEQGASVYYTDNGDTPTSSSTLYNAESGITLSATKTIKAVAILNGQSSEVASGTYTKN